MIKNIQIRFEFKLEDMWIGVFWKNSKHMDNLYDINILDVWVCFIPCFPLHITKTTKKDILENYNNIE